MTARDVRKQSARHDLFHRLHSIASDCRFVEQVSQEWYSGRYDVIANQRCGSWYCDPSTTAGTFAYFKSTDGHTNNWDFNLRRSNLPLSLLAEQKGGIILVDSTRRGKRMPDALSKTVPIWCTVINLAISRSSPMKAERWDTALYTPPNVVSPSEKSQIEALLPLWADSLLTSSLPLPNLTKPLRPFFIHPSTSTAPIIPPNAPFTPIICLSASRWVGGEDDIPSFTRLKDRTVAFEYVQGAGDDDELWAKGLTPAVFHQNKVKLLSIDRDDLVNEVDRMVTEAKAVNPQPRPAVEVVDRPAIGTPSPDSLLGLAIGDPVTPQPPWSPATSSGPTLVVKVVEPAKADVPKSPNDDYILPLSGTSGAGNEEVVVILADPRIAGWAFGQGLQHAIRYLRPVIEAGRPVLLTPGSQADLTAAFRLRDSDKDDSADLVDALDKLKLASEPSVDDRKRVVPLAVALLCSIPQFHLRGTTDAETRQAVEEGRVDKVIVGDMLHRLVALWPDANPPRAALKRINEVMMGASHA